MSEIGGGGEGGGFKDMGGTGSGGGRGEGEFNGDRASQKTAGLVILVVIIVIIAIIATAVTRYSRMQTQKRRAWLREASGLSKQIEQRLRSIHMHNSNWWAWGDQIVADAASANRALDYVSFIQNQSNSSSNSSAAAVTMSSSMLVTSKPLSVPIASQPTPPSLQTSPEATLSTVTGNGNGDALLPLPTSSSSSSSAQQQHGVCEVKPDIPRSAQKRLFKICMTRTEIQAMTDALDRTYDLYADVAYEVDRLSLICKKNNTGAKTADENGNGGGAVQSSIGMQSSMLLLLSQLESILLDVVRLHETISRGHGALFHTIMARCRSRTQPNSMNAREEVDFVYELIGIRKCLDELAPQINSHRPREPTGVAVLDNAMFKRQHEHLHTKLTRINDCRKVLDTFSFLKDRYPHLV